MDELYLLNQFNNKFYALQGRKQILTGTFCEAIDTLYRVLSNDHKNCENYYQFGIALYINEQYEEALAAFEYSQQINNVRSILFIGSCYYQLKCQILALSWINKALKLSPNNKEGLYLKQLILQNDFEGNFKQIMEIRFQIQEIDPTYDQLSNHYCRSLKSQNEPLNLILNVQMTFLMSKYYPIQYNEPKEFMIQIQQEKFAQSMQMNRSHHLKQQQSEVNQNDFIFLRLTLHD